VTDPLLSQVRLLIGDTVAADAIFQDDEINQFIWLESSQALYASPQFYQTAAQVQPSIVPQVYSVRRAAALALDSMASNQSVMASIIKILDVSLGSDKSAKALRDQADSFRKQEAESGAFAIAEWVNDAFSARERVWKTYLRLYAA